MCKGFYGLILAEIEGFKHQSHFFGTPLKVSMKTVGEFQARLVDLEKRMSAIECEQDEIDSLAYRTLTKMDFLHFRYKLYTNHCEKYCL